MASLDSRYTQVEFNPIPVEVHIGPAYRHSESAKKIGFIGLKWLGYYVEQGSALGFEVFQFFLIEILLQSWKK